MNDLQLETPVSVPDVGDDEQRSPEHAIFEGLSHDLAQQDRLQGGAGAGSKRRRRPSAALSKSNGVHGW
jgi:hypothetical protein